MHSHSCFTKKESCPSNSEAESIRNVCVSASFPTLRRVNRPVSREGQIRPQRRTTHRRAATPPEGGFALTTACLRLVWSGRPPVTVMKSAGSWGCASAIGSETVRRTGLCLQAQAVRVVILDSAESLNKRT